MEYEEYLREVVKDRDHVDHIHASVNLSYFPFTTKCPKTGRTCKCTTCDDYRYVLTDEGQCFYFELNRVMYKVFGTGDNWVSFDVDTGDEDTYLNWRINQSSYYPDDKGEKYRCGFSVGSDNYTITWKVLHEAGLGDYFTEAFNVTAFFPQDFEALLEIQKFLELIKEKKDDIGKLLMKYHTCVRCKRVDSYGINFYDPVGICDPCVGKVTEEWLKENGFNRRKSC